MTGCGMSRGDALVGYDVVARGEGLQSLETLQSYSLDVLERSSMMRIISEMISDVLLLCSVGLTSERRGVHG